jgi:hypothetical protein
MRSWKLLSQHAPFLLLALATGERAIDFVACSLRIRQDLALGAGRARRGSRSARVSRPRRNVRPKVSPHHRQFSIGSIVGKVPPIVRTVKSGWISGCKSAWVDLDGTIVRVSGRPSVGGFGGVGRPAPSASLDLRRASTRAEPRPAPSLVSHHWIALRITSFNIGLSASQ